MSNAGPSWISTSAIVKLTRSLQIDHADSSAIILPGELSTSAQSTERARGKKIRKRVLVGSSSKGGTRSCQLHASGSWYNVLFNASLSLLDPFREYAESSLIRRRAKNQGYVHNNTKREESYFSLLSSGAGL
ncbi:hypothetical protein TESG_08041 [Trichophyton tonsurans CBS 112818]|uniref:Uncharacterized protein n=2 Tax=Trichophyton TaxID=5550 RepID=F2PWQ0_TRIEC|nr:hypothetical protein TESG_08041 [Trichophyton tonsurans CBS 112818]EGE06318.1 hypothetical protein TEQG_05321 [Trichophyton equinum CBS 127.97]